jgi:hypothetical protein
LRDSYCLTVSCFCIDIYASGVIFGSRFQSLIPPWLGFHAGLYRTAGGWALMCFLVSTWWSTGSIVLFSAFYSQGAEFYTLCHLAVKAATVVKLQPWNYSNPSWRSFIATALLLLLLSVILLFWLSIEARMYVHGHKRQKVVGVVIEGRQRGRKL